MNGTWKENISGYDRKSNFRKKHTRKHTLNDKAKWHIKNETYSNSSQKDTGVCRIEGEVEITQNMVKNKKQLYVDVWTIDVDNYDRSKCNVFLSDIIQGCFEGNIKTAFNHHGRWYDIYTYEFICGSVKELNKIDTIYLDWDESLPEMVRERGYCSTSSNEIIYLYGKPLPVDWHNIFGFWSTKGRGYAQKKVNSMDRQRVRNYIARENWDEDVKTHSLSKSIAWEIY